MYSPDWSQKTILVVEDEEINRFYFKTALQMTKVNLLFAVDGLESVEIARNNKNIDCVLMDMRLPGIDGYEATKHIKSERKDLPIIAQTAYALSNERAKALNSGCDEFLAKPIKLVNLFNVLKKYMDTN